MYDNNVSVCSFQVLCIIHEWYTIIYLLPPLDPLPLTIMAVSADEGGGISLVDDVPDMSHMDYDLEYSVRMGKTE